MSAAPAALPKHERCVVDATARAGAALPPVWFALHGVADPRAGIGRRAHPTAPDGCAQLVGWREGARAWRVVTGTRLNVGYAPCVRPLSCLDRSFAEAAAGGRANAAR